MGERRNDNVTIPLGIHSAMDSDSLFRNSSRIITINASLTASHNKDTFKMKANSPFYEHSPVDNS